MKTTKSKIRCGGMSTILVLRSELLRRVALVVALGLMVCLANVSEAAPMGSAFTYQGRLMDANSAADGEYDFEFSLYDSVTDGNQVGSDVNIPDVNVIDGYFTVELDFGSGVFDGNDRWLETGVRSGTSSGSFATLSPRLRITATPYAVYALSGTPGPKGDKGDPGPMGPRGPKGDPGDCGANSINGTWTVDRVIGQSQLLRGVVDQVAAGDSVDGSLVYLNDDYEEARRINFFDIVPVSFEMFNKGDYFLEETLTFMVSRVELGLSTKPPSPIYTDNFIFYLNGQAVDGVIRVVPGLIFFDSPEPQPIDRIPKTPILKQDEFSSHEFTFDLVERQAPPDPNWDVINGGEMQFLKIDWESLEITFSEVVLSGPMDNTMERTEMVDWLNEWLDPRGTGTATNSHLVINPMGPIVLRIDYWNVVPVSYWPPAVDVTEDNVEVRESLTLRASRIEVQ